MNIQPAGLTKPTLVSPRLPFNVLRVLFLMAAISGATTALGQLVFTATGTCYYSWAGYINGNTYDFTFTTGAGFSDNSPTSSFTATSNSWWETVAADDPIFTALGGTGLGGTYSRPTNTSTDPNSFIYITDSGSMELRASRDSVSVYSIGLTTPDNTPVDFVSLVIDAGDINFTGFTGSYTPPATYFADYLGVHSVGGALTAKQMGGPNVAFISITSLSISLAAIPEPSTYAAILGALIFSSAILAKRRKLPGSKPR